MHLKPQAAKTAVDVPPRQYVREEEETDSGNRQRWVFKTIQQNKENESAAHKKNTLRTGQASYIYKAILVGDDILDM